MRSTVSFLIGCVLGATGVLVYLHETRQLAVAAEPTAVQRAAMVAQTPKIPNPVTGLIVPVEGVLRTSLRRDFTDNRGGGRTGRRNGAQH